MDLTGVEPVSKPTFLFQSNENWLWGVMESNHRDRSVEPASLTAKWTPHVRNLHFTIVPPPWDAWRLYVASTNFSYLFKVRVSFFPFNIAGLTGFEPAPHAVTGRHCKPFNHRPISIAGITGLEPAPPPWQGGTCNQFNYTPIKRLLSEIINCNHCNQPVNGG